MARIASSAFVGRVTEFARLRAALDRARTGETAVILLGGDAGVGKTRLIDELIGESRAAGSIAIVGGSPIGSEADLPFASLVEALRSLARQLPAARLDEVLGPARHDVARLLPALAGGDVPRPDSDDATGLETAQTRLFEAILGVLDRVAAIGSPAILVLEDLQWADRSTGELLAFLVRNLRDASIMVVGTYRSDGIASGHPLRTLLAELERAPGVERLELNNLGREDVVAQLEGILGGPPRPALVDEVFARSDGNPFFVEELAAAIAAGGRGALSDTLRETLLGRISTLSVESQELLRSGAIVGREFDPGLIAAVVPFDGSILIAALREAVRHHLLVVIKDVGGDRFGFRHALVHEAVYGDILPLELGRRHALVAAACEANPDLLTGTLAEREVRLANHWLAADVPERALPALIRAGYATEGAYAFPEAARAFEAALRIWDRATLHAGGEPAGARPGPIGFRMRPSESAEPKEAPIGRSDIMRHAAETAALAGAPDRSVELTRELLAEMDPTTDPLTAGLATERLGRYQSEDGDGAGALESYRRAADLVADGPPSAGRARILGALGRALVNTGQYADAQHVCEQAIEIGLAADATSEVRRIRATYGVALAFQGDVEGGLGQLVAARKRVAERTEMSVVRPRPSRIGDVVRGYADLAAILERAGRPGEAADASMEGTEIARSLGVETTWGSTLEVHAAVGRYHLGEWDEADRMTRRLLGGQLRGTPAARLHVVRARLETGRGAFDDADLQIEAARVYLPAAADPTLVGELAAAVAELAIWRAQMMEARLAADEGLRRIHDGDDQLPVAQLCWLGIRAEADRAEAARVRRLTAEVNGAREVAASLRAELVGIVGHSAERVHLAPRELRVFPAFVEAEWGRLGGVSDIGMWAEAGIRADEVGDPWLAAYARWREAEASLTGRGGKGRAESVLRAAHATAAKLGAGPLLRETESLAKRGRLDLAPAEVLAAAPADTPMDRVGLTTREQEVLALMAEGMTNRQIADELFITEKTAGHHVSNVLGKLGAASRVEAAAMAHRAGWLDEEPHEPSSR